MDNQAQEPASCAIPEDAAGLGAVQDGERAFIFGFTPHREVFARLGFIAVPDDDEALTLCGKSLCELIRMQAVLKAMTVTPEQVLAALGAEALPLEAERSAAMVVAAARQAVTDYAAKRSK